MSTFTTKFAMIDCTLAAIDANASEIAYHMINKTLSESLVFHYDMREDKNTPSSPRNAIGYGIAYQTKDKDGNTITKTKCTPSIAIRLRRTRDINPWSFAVRTTHPDLNGPGAFEYLHEKNNEIIDMYQNKPLHEMNKNDFDFEL